MSNENLGIVLNNELTGEDLEALLTLDEVEQDDDSYQLLDLT